MREIQEKLKNHVQEQIINIYKKGVTIRKNDSNIEKP